MSQFRNFMKMNNKIREAGAPNSHIVTFRKYFSNYPGTSNPAISGGDFKINFIVYLGSFHFISLNLKKHHSGIFDNVSDNFQETNIRILSARFLRLGYFSSSDLIVWQIFLYFFRFIFVLSFLNSFQTSFTCYLI